MEEHRDRQRMRAGGLAFSYSLLRSAGRVGAERRIETKRGTPRPACLVSIRLRLLNRRSLVGRRSPDPRLGEGLLTEPLLGGCRETLPNKTLRNSRRSNGRNLDQSLSSVQSVTEIRQPVLATSNAVQWSSLAATARSQSNDTFETCLPLCSDVGAVEKANGAEIPRPRSISFARSGYVTRVFVRPEPPGHGPGGSYDCVL